MNKHYYWTCPYCNANLDPGELCDCQESREVDMDESNDYKSVQRRGENDSDKETLQQVCLSK